MSLRWFRPRRREQAPGEPPRVTRSAGARDRSAGARDGYYLTDGRRLYRVVSHFYPAHRGRLVGLLEDCLTLELSPYSPSEGETMRLVSVRGPVRAA